MQWQSLLEHRSKRGKRVLIQGILFVNKGFKLAQFRHAADYLSELVAIDPVIGKQDAVDNAMVQHFAGISKPTNIALGKEIVLQAQSFLPYLVQYWQHNILHVVTFRIELDARVFLIGVLLDIFELLLVLFLLDELVSDEGHLFRLFFKSLVKGDFSLGWLW